MFRFAIMGRMPRVQRQLTIALTDYADVAEYILEHAAEALDPDGSNGLEIELTETREAANLIRHRKNSNNIAEKGLVD